MTLPARVARYLVAVPTRAAKYPRAVLDTVTVCLLAMPAKVAIFLVAVPVGALDAL